MFWYKAVPVTPSDVVLLICSVVLLLVGCLEIVGLTALSYFARKLKATDDVWREIIRINAYNDELTAQVVKLRTSKAGRRSAEKKQEQQAQQQQEEDDPWLEGLSEDDKALFK